MAPAVCLFCRWPLGLSVFPAVFDVTGTPPFPDSLPGPDGVIRSPCQRYLLSCPVVWIAAVTVSLFVVTSFFCC